MGGDDLGGDDMSGDVEEPMGSEEPQMEQLKKRVDKLLTETKQELKEVKKMKSDKYYNIYTKHLKENTLRKNKDDGSDEITPIMDKFFIKNDEMNKLIDKLDGIE